MTFITTSTPPPTEVAELIKKAIKIIINERKIPSLPKEVCAILEEVALADALSRWEELVDPEIHPTR